jgi:endonuclease/exonuclease/phosphatase family metal-dependent hydrolase
MRLRLPLLLAVAVLLGIVWNASQRTPSGPDAGAGLPNGKEGANPARETLRIGTFNIHGGKGSDGRRDMERVADCLADLDFVGLEEVHSRWPWESVDQAQWLGRRLGRSWLFAPAVQQWYHDDFGNGLISALRVTSWQRIPLPSDPSNPRNAILATVEYSGGTIRILVTHLTRRNPVRQDAQLQAVSSLFLSLAEPAILLGDMNARPDHPLIRQLRATPGVVEPFGELRQSDSTVRIDWIFLRGLRALHVETVDRGASDHPLVWVEVRRP